MLGSHPQGFCFTWSGWGLGMGSFESFLETLVYGQSGEPLDAKVLCLDGMPQGTLGELG